MAAGAPETISRRDLLLLPALAPILAAGAAGFGDDPFFGEPVIDVDAWRTGSRPHRFVHGHFKGTDTRFVIGLPDREVYRSRFVQYLQGGRGGDEYNGYNRGSHLLAFEHGALYVESNQGHLGADMSGLKGDLSILNWRASAQTARFARTLAREYYGQPPRFGYVMGGSGGGMRSINCMEARPDLWQGAVPFMINRNGLIVFNWSLTAWASNVLQARLGDLAQASLEGEDTFAVLKTPEERAALTSLYRAGYPRGAEDQLGPNPLWIMGMQAILAQDPRYFIDFWREDGYAGKAATPQVQALTLEMTAEVEAVVTGAEVADLLSSDRDSELTGALRASFRGEQPAAVRLKGPVSSEQMLGASLTFETGAATGRRVLCTGSAGGALTAMLDAAGFVGVRPGDRVLVSNRALVAFLFYHRHFVDVRYPGMAEFFDADGPRFVQRPVDFNALDTPSGALKGKMILLQHRLDREALPTCAEPYVRSVHAQLGVRMHEQFRVWWLDNAQHGVPQAARTRYIDFRGCFAQALSDVIAWAEEGAPPPASSAYRFDARNQLVLPDRAESRRGIQPTVSLEAPRQARVGRPVRFSVFIEAPPGAGYVVAGALDLDGTGAFATSLPSPPEGAAAHAFAAEHVFQQPGRYVVAARGEIRRAGSAGDYRVQNLSRRVVVVR